MPSQSNGGILRPPVLSATQSSSGSSSSPRICEILSMSNPVLKGNNRGESAGPAEASEKRYVYCTDIFLYNFGVIDNC